MTLVEFLTARLDEDEARAPYLEGASVGPGSEARVLREVEAKRALLKEHALVESSDKRSADAGRWGWKDRPRELGCERCDDSSGWIIGSDGCPTLRHLATIYADHPDYDESWRP